MANGVFQKKVCMVGVFGTGKTSLVAQFVFAKFTEKYHKTIGVKIDRKEVQLGDANVKAVLINIFGGIVRCDLVAEGVVEGAKRVEVNVPVVVRIEGNQAARGREILASAPFDIIVAEGMEEAGAKAVAAAKGESA